MSNTLELLWGTDMPCRPAGMTRAAVNMSFPDHLCGLATPGLPTKHDDRVMCDGFHDLLLLAYDGQLAPGSFNGSRPLDVYNPGDAAPTSLCGMLGIALRTFPVL